MSHTLETDYLVVGAGATGMAFVDELIAQSKTVRVIIVDKRDGPGGHWNNAYSFVTLHQPADFYGVNSECLENHPGDFASKEQIVSYYKRVMDKLCDTGRVQFFPGCVYEGDGVFHRLNDSAEKFHVTVHRRVVDATYSNVRIPAEHTPAFEIDPAVSCVPLNALSTLDTPWEQYVVIGAGKTGIDAILELLRQQIDPDQISWIISHDPWLINRDVMKTERFPVLFPQTLREATRAQNARDYLRLFESKEWFLRIDPSIETEHFRCATVTMDELDQLRRVSNIIRLGRVQRIESNQIVLDRGTVPTNSTVLHIDCAANGLQRRPVRPVFEDRRITIQPLVLCQPAFSAALTASIEIRSSNDVKRNQLSEPVPYPNTMSDYFEALVIWNQNIIRCLPGHWRLIVSKRLSVLPHISLWGKARVLVGTILWGHRAIKTVKRFVEQQRLNQR